MPSLRTTPANEISPTVGRTHAGIGYCRGCNQQTTLYALVGYLGLACAACLASPPTCPGCHRPFLNLDHGEGLATPLCYDCHGRSLTCVTCGRMSGPAGNLCTCSAVSTPCVRCCRGVVPDYVGAVCTRCRRAPPTEAITADILPDTRPVGIELEFCSRELNSTARNKLAAWGHLHGDGSLRTNGAYYETLDGNPPDEYQAWFPYELGTWPERGDVAANNVTQAAEFLRTRFDAYTNESCGLHTHVYVADLRDEQRTNIRNWWRVHEYSFFRALPSWRMASTYARPIANVHDSVLMHGRTKYWALWPGTLYEHGTYEFRLHHGTLNPKRIIPWANLLLRFIEGYKDASITYDEVRKKVREPKRKLFGEMCVDLELPLSLRKWMLQSAAQYWTRRCGLFRKGVEDDVPPPPPTPQPVDLSGAARLVFERAVLDDAYAHAIRDLTNTTYQRLYRTAVRHDPTP